MKGMSSRKWPLFAQEELESSQEQKRNLQIVPSAIPL
jgi:small neutral amino acid transporter SnatA (MarC family)